MKLKELREAIGHMSEKSLEDLMEVLNWYQGESETKEIRQKKELVRSALDNRAGV